MNNKNKRKKMENKKTVLEDIRLVGSNVLLEWNKVTKSRLELPREVIQGLEAQKNGICKVLAVGTDCRYAQPGDYVLLNSAGKLITLEGVDYAMVKEHQIDACFSTLPNHGEVDLEHVPGLILDKTISKAAKFEEKHNIKGTNL